MVQIFSFMEKSILAKNETEGTFAKKISKKKIKNFTEKKNRRKRRNSGFSYDDLKNAIFNTK